jgi:hypothetical protein
MPFSIFLWGAIYIPAVYQSDGLAISIPGSIDVLDRSSARFRSVDAAEWQSTDPVYLTPFLRGELYSNDVASVVVVR